MTPIARLGRIVGILLADIFLIVARTNSVQAQKYQFTDLGSGLYVHAINSTGEIVGSDDSGNGFVRYPDGTIARFRVSDSCETGAYAINKKGAITGACGRTGFIRSADGTVVTFRGPNDSDVTPLSINAKNSVVGLYACNTSCACHSQCVFIRHASGNIESLGELEDVYTSRTYINDQEAIVGSWIDSSNSEHGFTYSPEDKLTTFDVPGSTFTTVWSVNNRGWIVGTYDESEQHAFLRDPQGTIVTISDLLFTPNQINDHEKTSGSNRKYGLLRSKSGKISAIKPARRELVSAVFINDDGVLAGNYYHKFDPSPVAFVAYPIP